MSARFPPDCPEGFLSRYFVIPGDTMAIIAARFGIVTEELIAVNPHISDPEELFPGDVLCVPGFRRPLAACPAGFQVLFEVDFGDTIAAIAERFNVSVDDLIAANPHIPDPARLYPGDILCVP